MSNEEATRNRLKNLLYMKVYRELVSYEEIIRIQGVDKAMTSAYEIATKRDILMMIENGTFKTMDYEVLLGLENTLDALYREWIDFEDDTMESMICCTERFAKTMSKL